LAFFAFWWRENWGENNKALFCARLNFRAAKKRQMLQTCGKPYGNACYAGYDFLPVVSVIHRVTSRTFCQQLFIKKFQFFFLYSWLRKVILDVFALVMHLCYLSWLQRLVLKRYVYRELFSA